MSRCKVGDVMTIDVVSVREDAPFREIVDLLETRRVSALPVVNQARMVVGVVSEADLLRKMEFAGVPARPRLFEGRRARVAREKAAGRVARELMSAPAVTIMAHTSVVEAARQMESAGVKRLPVVNLAGRLVGIVSRGDLLDVFQRSDAAITEDVRRELGQLPGVESAQVNVETTRAVVTLTGTLDRRSLVPVVSGIAERADGVVGVTNRLTYRLDDTAPVLVTVA
jgi:CBS domain-containing protein